jgi:glycosyltransferase involved in cell wall biosynthesis
MRIGIDVHSIGSGKGGNETYYRQLVKALFQTDLTNGYVLYGTEGGVTDLAGMNNPRFELYTFSHPSPYARIPFEIPTQAFRHSLDIFHAQYIVPPFLKCRAVVTIFDLAYEHFPEFFPAYQRAWSKTLIRWSAHRADHIITLSEYSKRSIASTYHIPDEKITVTYLAASDDFFPMQRDWAREEIARKYGIKENFILYLGRLQGRKNIPALVDAFARIRRRGFTHKLVLAGKRDSLFSPVLQKIDRWGLQAEVLFPGYIRARDVPLFYNAAEVFVFPSLYEGFGLPVLEAMACGTPVITSSGTALEEVAGDAALLVDPPDDLGLANALEVVLADSEVRNQLSDAGIKRNSEFSFNKTARQTVQVYEIVAGSERARNSFATLRRSA